MADRQNSKIISLKDLILKYQNKLDINELDDLLALTLHKNIEYIYKHPEKKLSRSNISAFKKRLNQRLAGWSIAALKGQKGFFGLNFLVNKYTLIPRPASELLVEEALKSTQSNQKIIDIGTGSGCLILSIAKNNKYPAAYWATDISGQALKVAASNARKLSLKNKVKFIKSNLLKNISGKFDIVIANLPYLNPKQMEETSIAKEPPTALLSGQDGLKHYKKLLTQLPKHLEKKYLILLEIDPDQFETIKKEVLKNLPQAKIKFLKDLAQNIRLVRIKN